MNWKEISVCIVSCAITVALLVAFDPPNDPPSCVDGWNSQSIGRQGACSHHGGVDSGINSIPWYLAIVSVLAGVSAFLALAKAFDLFQAPETGPYTDPTSKMILLAIKDRRKIEFMYQKKDDLIPQQRLISPIGLKMLAPGVLRSRCVTGYCHSAKAQRTFALCRMSCVRIDEA